MVVSTTRGDSSFPPWESIYNDIEEISDVAKTLKNSFNEYQIASTMSCKGFTASELECHIWNPRETSASNNLLTITIDFLEDGRPHVECDEDLKTRKIKKVLKNIERLNHSVLQSESNFERLRRIAFHDTPSSSNSSGNGLESWMNTNDHAFYLKISELVKKYESLQSYCTIVTDNLKTMEPFETLETLTDGSDLPFCTKEDTCASMDSISISSTECIINLGKTSFCNRFIKGLWLYKNKKRFNSVKYQDDSIAGIGSYKKADLSLFHQRFFWINPFTMTIYWSTQNPPKKIKYLTIKNYIKSRINISQSGNARQRMDTMQAFVLHSSYSSYAIIIVPTHADDSFLLDRWLSSSGEET